jgi:hypothetical protein
MLPGDKQQKSLSGRFLLILGAVVCVLILGGGVVIIFDDNIFPNLTKVQRILIGIFFMFYAILRFSRVFKKKTNEI